MKIYVIYIILKKTVAMKIIIEFHRTSFVGFILGDMTDIPSLLKKLTYIFSRASVISPWKIPLIKVFSEFINDYRYNSNL